MATMLGASNATISPTPPPTLLNLPLELLIKICEEVVIHRNSVVITRPSQPDSNLLLQTKQPPLTRVCRVLRHEALRIFYEKNEFLIYDDGGPLEEFEVWLANIGLANRAMLKGLYITTDVDQELVKMLYEMVVGRRQILRGRAPERVGIPLLETTIQIIIKGPKGVGRARELGAGACLSLPWKEL